jgi:neutral ceramidase
MSQRCTISVPQTRDRDIFPRPLNEELPMQAGVAQIDITPPVPVGAYMTGYTSRPDMPAKGVHDPLWARALVLDDGQTSLALVALDLIGLNPGRLPALVRAQGVDHLLLSATHTHGGPLILDLSVPYGENRDWPTAAPYLTWLEGRIIEAICSARDTQQEVRMSVGHGRVDLSFNRRQYSDGKVEMVWGQNRDRSNDWGPVDSEFGIWRIDDMDLNPIALLAHYACHPVVMGKANLLLTADFPGATMDYLTMEFPQVMPFFLQGGCGDLDPYIDVQEDFAAVRSQGEELGREVASLFRSMGPYTQGKDGALETEPSLIWRELRQTFRRFEQPEQSQELRYSVLRIGRELAFLALPGEAFVGLQLDLKARSPVAHTFLLGYTNGYAGYFPTRKANHEGGYGASWGETMHIEPRAGEVMVDAALEALRT